MEIPLTEINDISNMEQEDLSKDNDFLDIGVASSIKMLFLLLCMTVTVFSAYYKSYTALIVWVLISMFIIDMMGIMDPIGEFLKEKPKHKGGYENIESTD